jgi:hypothetical protein
VIDESETQPPALKPRAAESQAARLEDIGAKAASYIEKSKTENTRRANRADWQDFAAWCQKYRRTALPASADTTGRAPRQGTLLGAGDPKREEPP